jgi:hypothetical protein
MASKGSWDKADRFSSSLDNTSKDTAYIYSQIKNLGLKTVEWDDFRSRSPNEITFKTRRFLNNGCRSCLFIWEPCNDDIQLKKSYLFGVTNPETVRNWALENNDFLDKYKFLLTTQITTPGDGFVGSVYSNGEGKIIGETMHSLGVCNHRDLSQSSLPKLSNLDSFVGEEFTLMAGNIPHLGVESAREIIQTFGAHKGYFEFVYGAQNSKVGLYTTGYESGINFRFPEDQHTQDFLNQRASKSHK